MIGGEAGSGRVVDQHKASFGVTSSVAQGIEPQERRDASIVNAATALLFDIVGFVARQRSDDFDPILREEFGRVRLPGFVENGEIAAVDDVLVEVACGSNQVTKVLVEFRGAASPWPPAWPSGSARRP